MNTRRGDDDWGAGSWWKPEPGGGEGWGCLVLTVVGAGGIGGAIMLLAYMIGMFPH